MTDEPTSASDADGQPLRRGAQRSPTSAPREVDQFDESIWGRRFVACDPRAAEVFVEHFQPRITRLVERLLAWPDGAADVVQDVFVAALAGREKFRGDARLETWLFRIAVNKARAANRRRWLRRRLFEAWERSQTETTERRMDGTGAPPTVPSGRSPDEAALARESSQAVRKAVARLPQNYREVVTLYYLEEMTAVEAADVLGLTRGAVEVRLHRARQMLAPALADLK